MGVRVGLKRHLTFVYHVAGDRRSCTITDTTATSTEREQHSQTRRAGTKLRCVSYICKRTQSYEAHVVPTSYSIAREQDSRDSVKPAYQAFEQRRADARLQPLPPTITADQLQVDLSIAAPASLEEALELGQSLLQSASEETARGKGKKKKTAAREVPDALAQRLAEIRLEVGRVLNMIVPEALR